MVQAAVDKRGPQSTGPFWTTYHDGSDGMWWESLKTGEVYIPEVNNHSCYHAEWVKIAKTLLLENQQTATGIIGSALGKRKRGTCDIGKNLVKMMFLRTGI